MEINTHKNNWLYFVELIRNTINRKQEVTC